MVAPARLGWRWICYRPQAVLLVMAAPLFPVPTATMLTANTSQSASKGQPDHLLQLDWSAWNETGSMLSEGPDAIDRNCSQKCQQVQLRRLVHECSARLEVPGLRCGDDMVTEDSYRVPLFHSKPPCEFEVVPRAEDFEDLARKYSFRFIGDSTTRRLAESFMSIVSGVGSPHPKAQERIDFSVNDLKVIFDWAPFCSGPLSVGEMLRTVMDEEEKEEMALSDSGSRGSDSSTNSSIGASGLSRKRTVIITAFGIHDASYQLQVSQRNVKDWYRDQMPQDVLEEDGFYAAALAACRAATMQVVDAAVGGKQTWSARRNSPDPRDDEPPRTPGPARARRRRALNYLRGEGRRLEAEAVVAPLLSVGTTNSSDVDGGDAIEKSWARDDEPPPLVFLLQNNGYFNDPNDFQQAFLEEVHRIQRHEVGLGIEQEERDLEPKSGYKPTSDVRNVGNTSESEIVDATGEGVFLVDSSMSLFKQLACYRMDPSSHYHEPAKLVEGKMLWDLFALVDREERLS